MSSLLMPRKRQLNRLFHLMVICAVLGPTLGINLPGFKMTFFRVVFFLLAAGLLIRQVHRTSLASPQLWPVRWYAAFFAFWAVYGGMSLTWAGHLGSGIRYQAFLVMMLLLTLSFPFFIKGSRNVEQISRILFGVFWVLVVFGLIESLTFWHLPASRYFGKEASNPTSFFTNQNDFATAITLGLPFVVTSLYMIPMHRRMKGLVYGTGVMALCCLLMTGSRSNSGFALPLASLVWLTLIPFTVERQKLNRSNRLKGAGLVLLAVLLVHLMTSTLLSEHARDKLGSTLGVIEDLQGSWNLQQEGEVDRKDPASGDQSINMRKALIMNGLQFLHQSHYLGVGAGNIEYYMQGAPGVSNKTNIHNWWAEVLVNFGVVVFVLYMALYFLLLWQLWRLARVKVMDHLSPWVRWGAVSSFIALTGYFFGGMSPSTAIHFTPMWVVYGFALAVVAVGHRELGRGPENASRSG